MELDARTKQHYVDICLGEKIDRVRAIPKGSNPLGSAYLATIAGMWTNACRRPYVNPFDTNEDDSWIYKWFRNGYDDFSQAVGMTNELRKQFLDKEKHDDEKREAAKATKMKVAPVHPALAKEPKAEGDKWWKVKLW